jgi:uncharacterized membrane protein YphA (DoxX/SURF4 family)
MANIDWREDWRADTSLAYAIFRLTFGVNLMLRGVDRIFFLGLDNFANGMVKQFEMTWIGAGMIQPFAHTIPWIEMIVGACLIVGLLAWLQLTYAMAFFLLLATHAWNVISLDAMLGRGPKAAARTGVAGV